MIRWYVVRSRQGREHQAARELRNQRFTVELSKTYIAMQIGQRKFAMSRLRYVGYLFVAFDVMVDGVYDERVYAPIFGTRGVARLFCDAHDRPIPVHDAEIRAIQLLEDEEHDVATSRNRLSRHRGAFEPGDIAEVIRGRAYGFKGPVLSCLDGKVKLLAGMTTVEAPIADCTVIRRIGEGARQKALPQSLTAEPA